MPASTEPLLRHVRGLVRRPPACSEADLLGRFLGGDEAAFAALVERHGPMVLGVCRRVLGDADRAEDAAQATFLALARRAATVRRPEALAAWLHQAARHTAGKHRRADARRRAHEARAARPASADPLDEVTARELLQAFDEELQQLPEANRLPLILCCLEGCTQEEAARRLGWSAGSVKGRLERGRAALHAGLVRRGLTLAVALTAVEAARGATALSAEAATAWAAVGIGARGTAMLHAKALLSLLLIGGVVAVALAAVRHPDKAARVEARAAPVPRTDRHGDPLPVGAVARLGTVRWRAADEVEALAVAPDGKTVAAASRMGLCLFDAAGKVIKHIPATKGHPERLAFSPDSKTLACSYTTRRNKQFVQLWEVPAGRLAREVPAEHIRWLGWTPAGEPVAVLQAKDAVIVRELTAGSERRLGANDLPAPERGIHACVYAPAAKVLAFVDQRRVIQVWDVNTGKRRWALDPKVQYVRSMSLSLDGATLASMAAAQGADKEATKLWDLSTGKPTRTVAAKLRYPFAVAFAPDGKTLACVGWTELRFVDVPTGRQVSRTAEVASFHPSVAFSADGKTLVTTERYSPAVHVWDVATATQKSGGVGHTNRPGRIDFSPDGKQLATSGSAGNDVIVWGAKTGEPLAHIRRGQWSRACAFSADGRQLFTCWTGDQLEWHDAATGRPLHAAKLTDPERPDVQQSGLSMSLSDDRQTIAVFCHGYATGRAGAEPGLLITGWDAATRKPLFRRRRADFSFGYAVSPDLKALALSQGGEGKLLVEGGPGRQPVRIEDLWTGAHLLTLPEVKGQTAPLVFSPDGRLLATYTSLHEPGKASLTLRLWELESAGEVLALPAVGNTRVAFSADGRLLAHAAPRREILLWDLRQGKELRRLKGHNAEVTSLAFSPDGRRLVSGLADTTLLVWDITEPKSARAAPLDAAAAARAWAELGGKPRRAFAARAALVGSPAEAVALLKGRLHPVRPADAAVVHRLLADMESDSFVTREKAREELEKLGDRVRGPLLEVLKKKPPLDLHRRVERLLDRLRPPHADPETLRALRGVAVLEDVGTPAARQVLQALAGGATEARLTLEAKAALDRLARTGRR